VQAMPTGRAGNEKKVSEPQPEQPVTDEGRETIVLSVVVPAYNEQASIGACVTEVADVLGSLSGRHEIIVVDDGSADGTWDALKRLHEAVPMLRALRLATRSGQTAAFDAGFRAARGRYVVTMDADLQNDPADIPALLELMPHWDVVCGVRRSRRDSLLRRLSSRIANGVRNRLTGESIRDVGCSLRAIRTERLRNLRLYDGMHRFLPTLLRWDGCRVTEVLVNHRPRRTGKSKYGLWNRLFRALRDLMAVRWMRSRWLRYEVAEEV